MSLEGTQLGNYRLVRLLGSGGMGEVYLAEDRRIARQVAIKIVHNDPSLYVDAEADADVTHLFQREMKAIAALDHPGILPLYDFGEEKIGNSVYTYMVIPYRPEGSLDDWLCQHGNRESLPPEVVVYFVFQAANALQHVHNRGIIHQDVKPSNFLVRSKANHQGFPDLLLADFGIAKFIGTTSGMSISTRGTPVYMAPEQWSGKPLPATDQYALAIMAYQLLTGVPPFRGNLQQVMYKHIYEIPQPISQRNPHLSNAVDGVLLRALTKRPEERFASIIEFARTLQQALQYKEEVTYAPSQVKLMPLSDVSPDQDKIILPSPDGALSRTAPLPSYRPASPPSPHRGSFLGGIVLLVALALIIITGGSTSFFLYAHGVSPSRVLDYNAYATAITVANNPDPYPPNGQLILFDPLTRPVYWKESKLANYGGTCQFTNGGYQASQSGANATYSCNELGTDYHNFTFEVQMDIIQGDCGGLDFRDDINTSKGYLLRICQYGAYSLFRYVDRNTRDQLPLQHTASSAINTGLGQSNVIAIVANGDTLSIYVNSQMIDRVDDMTYGSGSMGVIACNTGNPTVVVYKNAKVWTF